MALLTVAGLGCAYHPLHAGGGRSDDRVYLEPVAVEGASVGDAADIEASVARSLAEYFWLSGEDTADLRLRVRYRVQSAQAPFSEPAVRAAEYQSRVELTAVAVDPHGVVRWRGTQTGQAGYLSTPGGLESLDGASRRATVRAGAEAAAQLIRTMRLDLERGSTP